MFPNIPLLYFSYIGQKPMDRTKTNIETIYDNAFKDATAKGEHRAGAHLRGLEAVREHARVSVTLHPFRELAARALKSVARRLQGD